MPRRKSNKKKPKLKQPAVPYQRTLNEMFPPELIREIAKETGMLKRERDIDPVVLFWTLVLNFGIELQRTITGMKEAYEVYSGDTIAYSSFYERFNPGLVSFLKEAVNRGLEELTKGENVALSKRLNMFKDVAIVDSTIIKLHDNLASTWEACRTNSNKAACKLSFVLSVVGDGPRSVRLFGERKNELKTVTIGPWVEGRVLLFDLGYFKYKLFDTINRFKGFFVSRLSKSSNPYIIAENRRWRGNSVYLTGQQIRDVLPRLKRQVIDAEVVVSFSRRAYKGTSSDAIQTFRLIGILDDDTNEYHLYLTNIPHDMMSAEDVAALYGYRWSIELLMKELKSTYRIDVLPFDNKEVVEALIYTAILTLIISRRLLAEVRRSNPEQARRIPRLRWSRKFAAMARPLAVLIMREAGIEDPNEEMMRILLEAALDPNASRERLDDPWIEY